MRDSLPELRLQKGGPGDDILQNLLYIHDHEAAIRRYTAVVTAKPYLNTCLTLAKRFLPAETNPLPANLVIYIEAMTLDAAVQTPDMYIAYSRARLPRTNCIINCGKAGRSGKVYRLQTA
jgi:hypothetical protein